MADRKPAEMRKAQILTTVLRLAYELGPARLTTGTVAAAVGLTQPAIFRHFPSKQALWQAAGEHIAATMSAAWDAVLAETQTPQERIAALIAAQLRQIVAYPAIPAILHSRELQTENPALRKTFVDLMGRFRSLLAAEVASARAASLLRADVEPEDCAVLLISLVQGLAIRWSLGNRAFALEEEGARLLGVQMRLFRSMPPSEGGV